MKKIAVAVSAALLAGSAFAANVSLYGRADTGLSYKNVRTTTAAGTESTKSFSMDSGNSTGGRWGLKGTEELGNGVKVGFVLESGFSSDTGKGSSDGLFNRESSLYLTGSFGTVYAGRMGTLLSDAGSTGWWGSMASPFGSGWGDIAGHEAVMAKYATRTNNTVTYFSPRMSGLQLSAQYAMGNDSVENKPAGNRYFAAGLDYQVGAFEVGALVDYLNKSSSSVDTDKLDDALTFSLAANYDCGFAKSFLAVQYYKDVAGVGDALSSDFLPASYTDSRLATLKGYGVNIGFDAPAFGGNFMFSMGYADGDVQYAGDKDGDFKGYTALAGYSYPFSKRTSVYAGAGWTKYKTNITSSASSNKTQVAQVMTGLVHKF